MPPPEPGKTDRPDDLIALIRRSLHELDHRGDPDVARLVAEIRRRHRGVAAVLLYGSYLRGKRDTLLDFYVLLDDLDESLPRLQAIGNRWLPPNVYYLSLPEHAGAPALRAKYATMTLAQFERAMHRFHSYFWARFTQPAGLVEARDEGTANRVAGAIASAIGRFVVETVAVMPPTAKGGERVFESAALWRLGLSLTYRCELRAEDPARAGALYDAHPGHFDGLLGAYAEAPGARVRRRPDGRFQLQQLTVESPTTLPAGSRAGRRWAARRLQGKALSVLRLVKAAGTFDDPLDYLLWKIERHSGIYLAPTERQRRHPLLFAWPLLWRLYRRGAFR